MNEDTVSLYLSSTQGELILVVLSSLKGSIRIEIPPISPSLSSSKHHHHLLNLLDIFCVLVNAISRCIHPKELCFPLLPQLSLIWQSSTQPGQVTWIVFSVKFSRRKGIHYLELPLTKLSSLNKTQQLSIFISPSRQLPLHSLNCFSLERWE